jgi:hypothetical protein
MSPLTTIRSMITWFPSLSSIMMRLAGAAHAEVLLGTELPTCFHSEDIISAPAERVRRISECALRVRVVHINQADVAYAHFGDVHRYVTCGGRHLLGVKSSCSGNSMRYPAPAGRCSTHCCCACATTAAARTNIRARRDGALVFSFSRERYEAITFSAAQRCCGTASLIFNVSTRARQAASAARRHQPLEMRAPSFQRRGSGLKGCAPHSLPA